MSIPSRAPLFRAILFSGLTLLCCAQLPAAGITSTDYDARLEKAVDFYASQKYSEAVVILDNLCRAEPTRKEAFLWLGNSQAQLQNWSAADQSYKSCLAIAPQDIEALKGLANALEKQGKPLVSKIYIKRSLEIEPNNTELKQALLRIDSIIQSKSSAPTPVSEPQAPANTSSQTPAAATVENITFWNSGLAGITHAKTVWWGWAICIVLFVLGSINTSITSTKFMVERFPNLPPLATFLNTAFAVAIGYILFWGIPSGWHWALLIVPSLICAAISAKSHSGLRY